MMLELLGLSAEQIATLGTAFGILLAAIYAGFRGYRARPKEGVVDIPKAAIPSDLEDQIDDIQNRVTHSEHKIDRLLDLMGKIYLDTQVIRAMRN